MDADLRARLLAEWKSTIQHKPPAQREAWLRRMGKVVLSPARVRELLSGIEAERHLARDLAPTPAWADAFYRAGEKIPARARALELLESSRKRPRNFAAVAEVNGVGMTLSRAATVVAEPGSTPREVRGVARQRLVPALARDLEDELDFMDAFEALRYIPPEYGRTLTVKDALAMGLREHKRRLHEGGKDDFACRWSAN